MRSAASPKRVDEVSRYSRRSRQQGRCVHAFPPAPFFSPPRARQVGTRCGAGRSGRSHARTDPYSSAPRRLCFSASLTAYAHTQGMLTMQIGESSRFVMSPDYAYGAGGFPGAPQVHCACLTCRPWRTAPTSPSPPARARLAFSVSSRCPRTHALQRGASPRTRRSSSRSRCSALRDVGLTCRTASDSLIDSRTWWYPIQFESGRPACSSAAAPVCRG